MAEEKAPVPAVADKPEETPAPSTSAEQVDGSDDVDNEAKKLMGSGRRHLVMKDVQAAVNCFQEASSLLGKKYGETADQCADAFFSYGMALLELARMEDGVLGNALEGMPEGEEEECDKEEDPKIPSAADLDEKERADLREKVYDAMTEEKTEKSDEEKPKAENGDVEMEEDKPSEEKCTEEKTNGEAHDSKAEKSTDETEEKAAEAVTEEKIADDSKGKETEAEESKGKETEAAAESKVKEAEATEKTEDSSKSPAEEADSSKTPSVSETPSEKSEETKPSEETEAAKPAAEETASKDKPESTDSKAEEDKEAEPMEGEEEGDRSAESEDGEENEGTEENEATEEKETEDEVDNLQLAWEMLDLSRVIFKRQNTKESQLKAAQACLKLGEVSIESENYDQAVEDFLACLNIQKEHLEEHDRLLAETHYQLGLAYQYSCKHDSAISHFTQSTGVIEKRVALLSEKLEKASGDSTEEHQKEMDELKGLLPDIKEKIEDSKEAQKTAGATVIALQETLAGGSSGFSKENGSTSTLPAPAEKSGDSTVPVTNCVSDISHLVRKKKRPEEESPVKEAKKSKAEPVENGSENGAGNGDAVVPTNEEVEKAEEAEKQTPMETAAVESTA